MIMWEGLIDGQLCTGYQEEADTLGEAEGKLCRSEMQRFGDVKDPVVFKVFQAVVGLC